MARIERLPKVSGEAAQPQLSASMTKVLDQAFKEAAKFKDEYVSTEHLLLAMAQDKDKSNEARQVLTAAGFTDITVERAHPTIIGTGPEEEARQALMMGPTARLIEEKTPDEATRQAIAREIEAAFAAEAASGPIRLAATIFLVAARRPV